MKKGYKAALASPLISLAKPACNAAEHIRCAELAENEGCSLIVFPELSLTGATCGMLYCQKMLTEESEKALSLYLEKTKKLNIVSILGLPYSHNCDGIFGKAAKIYNTAIIAQGGKILGVSISRDRTDLFSAPPKNEENALLCGQKVLLSDRNVISADGMNICVNIGNTLDAPDISDTDLSVLMCAPGEYIGLSEKLEKDASIYSLKYRVPHITVGAGEGESTTDFICSGQRLLALGTEIKRVDKLFSEDNLYVEISGEISGSVDDISSEKQIPVSKFPFISEEKCKRDEECRLALDIQSRALAHRMERSFTKNLVIGVSGGLDSTLALLVCARAVDFLGLPRTNITAVTMPCFGTTERTKTNALLLADSLGCTVRTIDIKRSIDLHFEDISHDKNNYNVVYENAQARERTQILMDIANEIGALVVGTGDLSELALGFATYNGDHMSMYAVNGSVPKTLMREIIRFTAEEFSSKGSADIAATLIDVVETPVSPELLPTDENDIGTQHTEKIVGPYELHDFFLYYSIKYGMKPQDVLSLAKRVFDGYTDEELRSYLDIYLRRFYSQQFKRSCLPDGPRVTEISFSPRGAWQMPSDVCAEIWRKNID